jgi:hypothetical protein
MQKTIILNRNKAHVVNSKGYYNEKFDTTENFSPFASASLKDINPTFPRHNTVAPTNIKIPTNDTMMLQDNTHMLETRIKYKVYNKFDFCNGSLAKRVKQCAFCESLFYFPVWFVSLMSVIFVGLVTTAISLAVVYSAEIQLKSYTDTCSDSAPCDVSRGLYCRKVNSSSSDYCNCPAYGLANTCDCPSSYFWNGLKCTPVYSYDSGPCSGDYSCYRGVTCDQFSNKCKCTDLKPYWDSANMVCDYHYQGCYDDCTPPTCAYDTSEVMLQAQAGSYQLEIDECLLLCSRMGKKYALMVYNGTSKCVCSNYYDKDTTRLADSTCNSPCSQYSVVTLSKCPRSPAFSAFKIGS